MTRLSLLSAIVFTSIGCTESALVPVARTADASSTATPRETAKVNERAVETAGMPIYITPYYNSQGLEVNVGAYSDEIATATADSIAGLAATMKREWALLPIETMYVMSIRLYDLGHKEDSVYWFYSAQYRARLFRSLLPEESLGGIGSEGFERIHAHNGFNQLAGEYINGYAFGDLDTLQRTIRLVLSENDTILHLTVIYPELDFFDQDSWPEMNSEVAGGFHQLLDYIATNAEGIEAARKTNGIEGKY